jgi:cytochrome c-type biogenesis protein CcmE
MADLDDELRAAVRACDATPAVTSTLESEPSKASSRGKGFGLLIGLVVLSGGILTLVLSAGESARFDVPVDRYMAEQERYAGKTARVEGTLVRGSLVKRDTPCEYRFTIGSHGTELPVRYAQCIVPDNFRDAADIDVSAIVTGALTPAGYFEASHIQPQCPSKYEEAQRKGAVMPHTAVQ